MILFLDFDGVLHPNEVYSFPNKPLELMAEGELFKHSEILENALLPYPKAKIVLSTSWVRVYGYDRTLKEMPQNLRVRVVGATWHKKMRQGGQDPFNYMNRFQQIAWHVRRNGIKNWLAIDDLFSGFEILDWPDSHRHLLVLTEQLKGLGCEEAQMDLNRKLMELHQRCQNC